MSRFSRPAASTVRLHGQSDTATIADWDEVLRAVEAEGHRTITVDLRSVTAIDMEMLRWLIGLRELLAGRGTSLVVESQ